jgi:glycine cleavage system H protein
MVALLVVLTFAAMLVVDHLLLRQPILLAEDESNASRPKIAPARVAGFNLPDNMRYHQGHTWALAESPEMVRVGLDEFAARVAGPVDKVTIPERGQWIRQGQKIISLESGANQLQLVSPIEGTVVDINEGVLRNPELFRSDPYGTGWLLTVNSPDSKTNFRNLLGGRLARRWMEESANRLRAWAAPAGAMAQDGGVAMDGLIEHLPADMRADATRELFLT